MKFKHSFILAVILIILFSLGTVAASENASIDGSDLVISNIEDDGLSVDVEDSILASDSSEDSIYLADDTQVSLKKSLKDSNKQRASLKDSNDDVDLSISMDVKTSLTNNQYNRAGSEVPWTITVSAINGTSHNTKVRNVLSENLQYLSSNATVGSYDSANGIWDIGDLDSSKNASLTILTKLKRDGTYVNKVYATTDSNDIDLLNNFLILSIKTGSSKITSNITVTSDDREGPQHNVHFASMASSDFIVKSEDEAQEGNGGGNNGGGNNAGDDNGGGSESNGNSNSQSGSTSGGNYFQSSSLKALSYHSLSNNLKDLLGSTSNDELNSKYIYDAIYAYDYTTIPILILALLLLVLSGIVSYDKIKSDKKV
ncbi:MAG: DUF11 domain-containing protein [Methanobrevibacter sp.]|nr:DUF11 domain-containing protein [Methanobrevibacter sp.]